MRRCSLKTLEQWSPLETPLLPFLAPRISAPWLLDREPRRAHSSAAIQQSSSYSTLDDNCILRRKSLGNVFQQQCLYVPRWAQKSRQAYPRCDARALHTYTKLDTKVQQDLDGSVLSMTSGVGNVQLLDAESVHEEGRALASSREDSQPEELSTGGRSLETSLFEPEDYDLLDEEDIFEEDIPLDNGQDIEINTSQATIADIRSGLQRLMPQDLVPRQEAEADRLAFTQRGLNKASAAAEQGFSRRAIRILISLIHAGLEPSDVRVLKICSTMLRRSKTGGGQYHDSSSIVAAISDAGVQLNLQMFNILMLNAAETDDPGTAWRIWQLLDEQDVQPDDYTYTILLSMCRRLDDRDNYIALMKKLRPAVSSIGPYLLTEMMASRYHFRVFDQRKKRLAVSTKMKEKEFMRVLKFYELHFALQPLRTLGILTPEIERKLTSRERNENMTKHRPLAATLGIVLQAFVRQSQSVNPVHEVYRHFRGAIRNLDRCILPLVSTTHVYNTFLKAMCRTTDTLRFWRILIRAMKQPFPPGLSKWETGSSLEAAKPDAQTWNIILNSYAQCATMTRFGTIWDAVVAKEGHVPDVVSWNARLQSRMSNGNMKAVSHDLLQMIDAGIIPNEYTRDLLARAEDMQALQTSIVNSIDGRMRDLKVRPRKEEISLSTFPYVDVREYVKHDDFTQKETTEQIEDLIKIAKAFSYLTKPAESVEIRKYLHSEPSKTMVSTTSAQPSQLVRQNFPPNVDLVPLVRDIEDFLLNDDMQSCTLPPLNPRDRRVVHEIADMLGLKSFSKGTGKSRFPVLQKTSETRGFEQNRFARVRDKLDRIIYGR